MFNLTNSIIFSCEIMSKLPERLRTTTKNLLGSLEKSLASELRAPITLNIKQVSLHKNLGASAISIEGTIYKGENIKLLRFCILYDLYYDNLHDNITLSVTDIGYKFILKEDVLDNNESISKINQKIKEYFNHQNSSPV